MRGQPVVCKDVSGTPIVRVEWESQNGLIFIHDQKQFEKRLSGESHLEPVGFPIEHVYLYDKVALDQAERDGIPPWSLLVPYNGEE